MLLSVLWVLCTQRVLLSAYVYQSCQIPVYTKMAKSHLFLFLPIFAEYNVMVLFYLAGLKFKWHELKLAQWATFPVFFGQVTSAYEGIGTVSISFAFI